MLSSVLHTLLMLAAVGQTTALALWGRQQPRNNGTSGLDKRQGTVLVTKFSTIFPTGDGSRPRTANNGYDCRVDLLNDLWGFCPNTVIAATDCGLAGSCVDSFSCSKGCGRTDKPYTTFTCSESNAPFCSTALLTLPNNVGPFTYLACGRGPSTDVYFAFTTTTKPTSSPQPTTSPTTTSSSPTSPRETARSNTASSTPQQTAQSTGPSNTASPTSNPTASDTTTAQSAPAPSNSSPNNTGAIIGGTFGCLALLCGCLIVIFWLRHRNRNAAAAAAAAAKTGSSSSEETSNDIVAHPSPPDYKGGGLGLYEPAELSARTPAAAAGWRAYPPMTPVELLGSGCGFGAGR
ncbi:hypothetical protein C8A01DRAFT_31999 [Parachaetomium inaequale]|uniref:Uncharacterized protein n=1 Tax=Parachaetomium inaequale TaxID=2588326 RepID=A0AAN6PMW0_9PEZI|nr:hypothetical protein C8A01DRAFT_31999 [Parachaetomium inaequale]